MTGMGFGEGAGASGIVDGMVGGLEEECDVEMMEF
jgi:hypothetical protein